MLFNIYSALGQNLKTSNSVGDIVFALIICVSGLLLFAVLIGNIQVKCAHKWHIVFFSIS